MAVTNGTAGPDLIDATCANTRVELNTDGASGAEMAFLVKGRIVFDDTDFVGLA